MKNCRRIPSYLLAILALAALCSQVAASPAYFGYTGLMMTPTADTLKMAGANFGAIFLSGDNNDTTFLSANFGLLQSLEVGAALIDAERGDSKGIINAKFGLLKETAATPALAIGLSDATDELDATPYIALSKSLPVGGQYVWEPRFHIGLGSGRLDGLFAGLSAKATEQIQLMLEYDTNDVNFGLQFAVAKGLRLHAGLIGGDNAGLGLNYNVGF